VIKPANVSEERTASIFRVTESVLIKAEVMWQEKNISVVYGGLRQFGKGKGGQDCPEVI
jgi:hypothetical protein